MSHLAAARTPLLVAAAAASLALAALLSACAPEAAGPTAGGPSPTSIATSSPSGTATATPSPTATAKAEIPDDCQEMLTDDVLAQLAGVPLNDPAFGPSGPQPDGSLICIWADPAADTTGLHTSITSMSRGPALDMLNDLADTAGFTCYTPDGGTRCEKTWPNGTYPVTDGRTLFWRDDILIDTKYSNLAPTGYTSAIIDHIWG
ncbi:hypothetical protein ACH3VR_17565 [Microbacterium sp. B2969]|uniref:DUF3558 domain-containing protein n=1 Tax=Microbacterium alkaliflavum TaxID=3248839 RepID=A0ABW7QDH2_9MICO